MGENLLKIILESYLGAAQSGLSFVKLLDEPGRFHLSN